MVMMVPVQLFHLHFFFTLLPMRENTYVICCVGRDLPVTIRITAVRISRMPMPRRMLKASPKTNMPMHTAVIGYKAPITAVGVEPMSCTATTMSTSDITVGNTASTKAYTSSCMEVSGCSRASGPT